MKFNYDMSICPYLINWKRGSPPPPPLLAFKVTANLFIAHLCRGRGTTEGGEGRVGNGRVVEGLGGIGSGGEMEERGF